ncbi:putative efflux protein, MATE family [Aciduliprofundum sp. MAR08-339]|uniref:MATE family efflux transporter n=1 Tax=Aciduliprofundum sp. (strain MAR08-339) TaxID=673860 RepID=UPI0002A4CD5C|nr:putative efflux protein, MATE family [Aciduliprofundum sp. MAR08-339]
MALRLSREEILEGGVIRTMFLLGWPMMLSSLLQTLYNLADMFWLGRLPQEEAKIAVAAINFTWPVVFFFISFAGGLGRGGIPIISQYIGSDDREQANHYTGQIFGIVIVLATIMALIGSIFSYPIFELIGAKGNLLQTSALYGSIIFLGLPFMFVVMGGGGVISAEGDTVTPLIISGVSVIINIILDPILIFGLLGFPRMGVFGAATATVIARMIAAAWLLYLLFKGRLRLKPKLRDFLPKWESVKFILRIGLPSSFSMSAMALGFVIIQSILAHLPNYDVAIATYGVANRIVNMMFVVVNGLASSVSIMLGQALGADLTSRAKKIAQTGIFFMFYLLLIASGIIYVFREPIIAFFVPNNPDIIKSAGVFLSIVLIGIPYFGIFRIVSSILTGSGHTFQSFVLSVSRLWGIRIPLAAYFALSIGVGMGMVGVWFAMAISNMVSAGIGAIFYFKGDWLKKIIKKPKSRTRVPLS